jgi:hypothetical protein
MTATITYTGGLTLPDGTRAACMTSHVVSLLFPLCLRWRPLAVPRPSSGDFGEGD